MDILNIDTNHIQKLLTMDEFKGREGRTTFAAFNACSILENILLSKERNIHSVVWFAPSFESIHNLQMSFIRIIIPTFRRKIRSHGLQWVDFEDDITLFFIPDKVTTITDYYVVDDLGECRDRLITEGNHEVLNKIREQGYGY